MEIARAVIDERNRHASRPAISGTARLAVNGTTSKVATPLVTNGSVLATSATLSAAPRARMPPPMSGSRRPQIRYTHTTNTDTRPAYSYRERDVQAQRWYNMVSV